jgi:release factor glutamine methyltransferase
MHELEERIAWLKGDWFDVEADGFGPFEVIVSNPPYISGAEFDRLPPEIRLYEPREALEGGTDGLTAIRPIVRDAPSHMVSGGWLFLEVGHDQWPRVQDLIGSCGGYSQWGVVKDYSGFHRVAYARAK